MFNIQLQKPWLEINICGLAKSFALRGFDCELTYFIASLSLNYYTTYKLKPRMHMVQSSPARHKHINIKQCQWSLPGGSQSDTIYTGLPFKLLLMILLQETIMLSLSSLHWQRISSLCDSLIMSSRIMRGVSQDLLTQAFLDAALVPSLPPCLPTMTTTAAGAFLTLHSGSFEAVAN